MRNELIDGVIYDMTPPPSSKHQSIVTRLSGEFYHYLKGQECQAFVAPFGVWLSKEDDPYVEPDFTVVCDKSKIKTKGCVGAPDLIVEVLSPTTAVKDKGVKLRLYRRSGIREYWIIDPSNETVEVYMLEANNFSEPEVYGKNGSVTVGLFPDLKIHLEDIFD